MQKESALNRGWLYRAGGEQAWEQVELPHTPRLEGIDCIQPFQGEMEYVKRIFVPADFQGSRIAIRFAGAMQNLRLYVNGVFAGSHFGGYLPYTADIDKFLRYGAENELRVLLTNADDPDTPPGRPTGQLDFLYYGGLYRGVSLLVTPKVYLTDAVQAGRVHSGGLLIETVRAGEDEAELFVQAHLRNDTNQAVEGLVRFRIVGADGKVCAAQDVTAGIPAQGEAPATAALRVISPALWSIDTPVCYTCAVQLTVPGAESVYAQRFGIRIARMTKQGFTLNGKVVKLFGVNRHQQYPYLGIAAPDEEQRREAHRLKAARINAVRLSHYPQSEAFLDECDKLGLLVIEPVPGWQYCKRGVFKKRLEQNLRDMIRRDRNHPSVVVYEVTPNETGVHLGGASDAFYHQLHLAAKEELPGCITSGDTVGRQDAEKVDLDLPYTGEDKRAKKRKPFAAQGRMFLTREYGDWAFGGNHSTSRCTRGDGEAAQLTQAWNFQWDHNRNMADTRVAGDLLWEGIDHARGYFPPAPVSTSGMLDLFRRPKFSYHFIRSQAPYTGAESLELFPAAWTPAGKTKLVIYANCQEVALFVNDTLTARKSKDAGPDVPFTGHNKIHNDDWMTKGGAATGHMPSTLAAHVAGCMFDGGNCRHIAQPPFTFTNLALQKTDVVTVAGYMHGREVGRTVLRAGEGACALRICADTQNLPLKRDGVDFLFVHVTAVDVHGTLDNAFTGEVSLSVDGGGCIYTNAVHAQAGVASFLVRAQPGAQAVRVTALAAGLPAASLPL